MKALREFKRWWSTIDHKTRWQIIALVLALLFIWATYHNL